MLLQQCEWAGVDVRTGQSVVEVTETARGYTVRTDSQTFSAPRVVLASGGLSLPKIASDLAFRTANRLSLKVVPPRAALVPLTWNSSDKTVFEPLSGISLTAEVACGGASFREDLLFTHRGLSGPAMLQISSYWRHGQSIEVDFLPDRNAGWLLEVKRELPKASLGSLLAAELPNRLSEVLSAKLGVERSLSEVSDKVLERAEQQLRHWSFSPNGTEGFAKAEVTVGGVSTAELSSKTMAAKKLPGLYFIGEAVDVTGWLGGYNFQWAWASGVAAG